MDLASRVASFCRLGERLRRFGGEEDLRDLDMLVRASFAGPAANPWFTAEHIRLALNNVGETLTKESIDRWLAPYRQRLEAGAGACRVGVVMAGNIPAVGFHDFMCVLISGHTLAGRTSSSDSLLIPAMAEWLVADDPGWSGQFSFTSGTLERFDAVIATGSDSTASHFEQYFSSGPRIIRGHRNSVAILEGSETAAELQGLAGDIMQFFGLGCRSVSKIFVPRGYDFRPLVAALGPWSHFADHSRYRNNLDYNRAIYAIGSRPVLDTGSLLVCEDNAIDSRVAMLHFSHYDNYADVLKELEDHRDRIQCVCGRAGRPGVNTPFGGAQKPMLWDYADGIDTMEFLLSLGD